MIQVWSCCIARWNIRVGDATGFVEINVRLRRDRSGNVDFGVVWAGESPFLGSQVDNFVSKVFIGSIDMAPCRGDGEECSLPEPHDE